MTSIVRALARYWFIVPLLLVVVVLQFAVGMVTTDSIANNASLVGVNQVSPNLPNPETTSTSTATSTATLTPTPTRTLTPTDTPTGTYSPTPTSSPTPTPTPTATSTPTPQPTPTGSGYAVTVPILMYHYLSTPPSDADAIRLDLSVAPDQFESDLAYLRQAGYETISFKQLSFALSQGAALPPKPIIISFDDGYRDQYENAFPILRKYGYTATFFVFTQPIDFNAPEYLTWDMVIEMAQAGMEFGSHSYSHPDLRGKDVDFLVFEILASKEAIEERTGELVRFFAFPSGRYDDFLIHVLKTANFWSAVTTEWGAEQSYANRFEMPRVRVAGNDTVEDLANKLRQAEK